MNKKILIGGVLLVLVTISFLLSFLSGDNPEPSAAVFSDQKTVIGKTTNEEIEKFSKAQKEVIDKNTVRYTFDPRKSIRSDEIITQNRKAVFERIRTAIETETGKKTIAQLTEQYGKPEKMFKNSSYYGEGIYTYLYNSKGVAFVGNPNTNEVFEIQLFSPMNLEQYLNSYGKDVLVVESNKQGE